MKEQLIEYQNELSELLAWFDWYDIQMIQYQRDIRMNGSSHIDISNLDDEALMKANRIKELRKLIKKAFGEL